MSLLRLADLFPFLLKFISNVRVFAFQTSNLAKANASESDKIKAAIAQSTLEYDPKK